jgi:hypothetical protein
MGNLFFILTATLPLYAFGFYTNYGFISISYLISVLIVILFIFKWMNGARILKKNISMISYFFGFIIFGVFGLAASPFGDAVIFKGTKQLIGISIMLIMSLALIQEINTNQAFILKLAKIFMVSLGFLSIIGISQFVVFNLTPYGKILEFDYFNNIADSNGSVWNYPGKMGGLYRTNSLSAEPAHYTRFLGLGIGVALLRVGLLGNSISRSLSMISPSWVAWILIIATLLSLSMLGWLLLLLVIIALIVIAIIGNKFLKISKVISIISFVLLVVGILYLYAGKDIAEKLFGILILFKSEMSDGRDIPYQALGSHAILVNIFVAMKNWMHSPLLGGGLGSHPIAYNLFVPTNTLLFGINSQEASGLFLRLLSETGMIGLLIFCSGIFTTIWKAHVSIWKSFSQIHLTPYFSVSIGIMGSFMGVVIVFLIRNGFYYDPMFWIMFGLVSAIPFLMRIHESLTIRIGNISESDDK